MTYDRTVSAMNHEIQPETVWQVQIPPFRFGVDAVRELGIELENRGIVEGATGVLITDDQLDEIGHVDRVREVITDAGYDIDVWNDTDREPSVATVNSCIDFVREGSEYDFFLGLGGGSCMDVAKATRAIIANGGTVLDYVSEPTGKGHTLTESGPPLVLIPTTAGTGAEISPVAILSVEDSNIKEAISSDSIRASAAILDPTFTTTLPPDLTAKTAMDALGHAIEGYTTHAYDELLRPQDPADRPVYAGRNDLTDMFGKRAIRLLSENIRRAVCNGDNIHARSNLLKGALFGAIAGLNAGASLAHAMAYPVGNRYGTYHGETIAVLTPASTLGYNAASDPARFAEVAELLGVDTDGMTDSDAAAAAKSTYVELQRDLGVIPSGLSELAGVTEDDIAWLAKQTVETQKRLLRCNPRPVTQEDVEKIYRESLHNW
jgi:alcohol dehydrogenase class IV